MRIMVITPIIGVIMLIIKVILLNLLALAQSTTSKFEQLVAQLIRMYIQ